MELRIRKKIMMSMIILIIILLIAYAYYTQSKEYTQSISGIRYQLNNSSVEEKVQIEIDGVYSRKILGGFKFEGDLYIDNLKLKCSISDNSHGILFSKSESGYLQGYGAVYMHDGFDKLSIIFDGWNTSDGITIAAPAQNRQEALKVSNEVMKEFLDKLNIGELK